MPMTPSQEIANALSMLLPTVILLAYSSPLLLLLGACMHLPVSFTYHLSMAFGRYADPIDNDMRRLDQTLQHVVCTLYSYATSLGSFPYTLMNLIINAIGIVQLWDPQTTNDRKRWQPIFVSGVLYLLPLLTQRGNAFYFLLAFLTFLLGGTAAFLYDKVLRGYGTLILHSLLAIHAYALVCALKQAAL